MPTRTLTLKPSVLLIWTAVFSGCLWAQITADVTGVVTDPAGSSIPSAKVTVTSKETG
jgi:hypothetical protein